MSFSHDTENSSFKPSSQNFSWWPLGGLGEVGMNCMIMRFGEQVLPIDAGILFANQNDFGIEAVFPDIRDLIHTHNPRDWIITHGHEDHIGAIPHFIQVYLEEGFEPPNFYAPPFASELIKEKLTDESRIHNGKRFLEKVKIVQPDSMIQLGEVEVFFMETRHSTPDTCSIGLRWRKGDQELKIVHTSDFKLDEHEFLDGIKTVSLYDIFKGQSPDILFIDSTNAEREGMSVSETEVIPGLDQLLANAEGRVYVTLFSSNVYRIAEIMRLGKKHGRYISLAGRSLQTAMEKGQTVGLFNRTVADISDIQILDSSQINKHPPHLQLIICSGSQGEQRSTLMRLSNDQHSDFQIETGDLVVFSSKTIPGNEKSTSRVVNGLLRQGAKVIWGDLAKSLGLGPIHASGHARRDEIKAVAKLLKPSFIVPVHGELRQLESSAEMLRTLGAEWGLERGHVIVVENGARLDFSHSTKWKLESLKKPIEFLPRMLRLEHFISSSREPFLKIRKRMALGGVVSAWIDVTGRVDARVFGFSPENRPMVEVQEIEKWLMAQYQLLKSQRAFDGSDHQLENDLAEDLSRHVRRLSGIRPFSIVHVIGK